MIPYPLFICLSLLIFLMGMGTALAWVVVMLKVMRHKGETSGNYERTWAAILAEQHLFH